MNNELKEYIMNKEMYYLKAPQGIWKQEDGTILIISDMEEKHIKSCINMIERHMDRLESRPNEIVVELMPMAEQKLEELKEELMNRN